MPKLKAGYNTAKDFKSVYIGRSTRYPPSSGRANSGWPIQVGQFRLGQFRFIPIQVNPDSVYQGRIQVVPIQVGANSGWG